eukprot:2587000-Rhodomonas_salina.2
MSQICTTRVIAQICTTRLQICTTCDTLHLADMHILGPHAASRRFALHLAAWHILAFWDPSQICTYWIPFAHPYQEPTLPKLARIASFCMLFAVISESCVGRNDSKEAKHSKTHIRVYVLHLRVCAFSALQP